MDAMGVYQIFAIDGVPVGGMMTKPAQTPAPFWLYYVNVEALDAGVGRAVGGGGLVLGGLHEVPGVSWIVQCADPQGATFAMVARRR